MLCDVSLIPIYRRRPRHPLKRKQWTVATTIVNRNTKQANGCCLLVAGRRFESHTIETLIQKQFHSFRWMCDATYTHTHTHTSARCIWLETVVCGSMSPALFAMRDQRSISKRLIDGHHSLNAAIESTSTPVCLPSFQPSKRDPRVSYQFNGALINEHVFMAAH